MNKKLIFIGGTGGCLDLIDLAYEINDFKKAYDLVGVLDDAYKNMERSIYGVPLLGGTDILGNLSKDPHIQFVTAIGNHSNFKKRAKILDNFGLPSGRWETLVHPAANVSRSALIGHGTAIHAGVSIGPNCVVGNNCLILPNTIIGHDANIADNVIINGSVAIAGNVTIEESCYIGIGATIKDHLLIKKNTLVGMGAVVISNSSANSTYVGNPARVLYEK